ncbi:MAG: DNA-formamidopyrimidine glycosylase family protein [Ilumatobacteraceae bacterium]
MPEGDTIRRLADKIGRRFAGERCDRCVTRDPRLVGIDLTGATLVEADAVGKHLFIRFDNGYSLHSHLRMTGSWTVGSPAREPEWRRRIELWMASGRLTGIDLPVVELLATAREGEVVGHLGPDLCGQELPDLDEVVDRMRRRPDEALATAVLDQRNVAGFGNVYAIEVPFIVGVSPNQPVGTIEGLDQLVGLGAALIRTSAERGPQNTTGRRLNTADHWIYARRGHPCPICASTLDGYEERESPWARVSVWCPTCQRVDRVRAVDSVRLNRLMALHPARRQPAFPHEPTLSLPTGSVRSERQGSARAPETGGTSRSPKLAEGC